MLKLKKSIFMSILLLISLTFSPIAFADIDDCRFMNNENVKKEIVSHIPRRGLSSVCRKCDADFNNITIDLQSMIFIIKGPLERASVEIHIPIINNINSMIFAEVEFFLDFSLRQKLTLEMLLDFFSKGIGNLDYKVVGRDLLYYTQPVENVAKYIKDFNFEKLKDKNLNQKVYYSYPKREKHERFGKYTSFFGIVQLFDDARERFYLISDLLDN